jgi:hypothetical protein
MAGMRVPRATEISEYMKVHGTSFVYISAKCLVYSFYQRLRSSLGTVRSPGATTIY